MGSENDYGAILDQDVATAAPALALVNQASNAATQPAQPVSVGSQPAAVTPPPVAGPDYDDLLDADKASQRDSLKQSIYAAKDLEPDRHAKVMALAAEMKLPIPIVDRNYDDLAKKKQAASTDYEQLIDENPKLSTWLGDPNNAAIAKKDMPALKSLEDQVNDQGFGQTLINTVGYAMAKFNSGLAAIPALAYDTAALPQNLIKEGMGSAPNIKAPDWLTDNVPAEWSTAAKVAYASKLPELNYSILNELKQMNFKRAGQSMLIQMASGAPDLLGLIGSSMLGMPELGLGMMGSGAAAAKSSELRDQGIDPVTGTGNALSSGITQVAAAELKLFGPLHEWEQAISNMYGKQVSSEVFKDMFKTLAGTLGVQGGVGATTSLSTDMTDYLTGVNPNALNGSLERAGNASLVQAATGLALVAPTGMLSGLARQQQIHQTNSLRDFYLSFGETAEATRLRANLPEAQRQLVDQVTRDTPVENIYVSPQSLDTYFQSKGLNPVAVMGELGVLPEYGAAKDTGGDVKIPLSTWVDKVVGSEHYKALANDIRFSPDGMSVNELSAENARLQAESGNPQPEQKTTSDQSAAQVGDTVATQLSALGLDPKQSQIYESAFRSLGERTGTDPLDLFNRFKLSITGEQPAADGTVLNQKTPEEINAEVEKALGGEDALKRYNEMPATNGGMIVSQDLARHLYEPYAASKEGATIHLDATSKHSEGFAQRAYEDRLKQPGDAPVVLMAGGTASGKSTYARNMGHTWEGATAVVDSTGANYKVMKSNIDKAIDAGKPVVVSFIYRPFDKALDGNAKRFTETGRLVPPQHMAFSHVSAVDTFLRLEKEYAGSKNVTFEAHDNSGINNEPPRALPIDELEAMRYNKAGESVNAAARSLKKDANERLKNELEQVRATKERVAARDAEAVRGVQAENAGQPGHEHGLGAGSRSEAVAGGPESATEPDSRVDGDLESSQSGNLDTPEDRVLKQAKLDTEGLPDNVIDASGAFDRRRENAEDQNERSAEDKKLLNKIEKFLGKRLSSQVSDLGKSMLYSFSARFDSKETDKVIKGAQKPELGPYVSTPEIPGIGWTPNYAAEPTGTIGPDRISQPNDVKRGTKEKRFGVNETEPMKWSDEKFKATKELITKHAEKDIPLVLNTSSDLIGRDDYIEVLPHETTVNMYLLSKNAELNRALFPGNASLSRQEEAVQKLRDAGVKVNAIRPTFDEVVSAAGGEKVIDKLWGDDSWREKLKKATSPQLSLLDGGMRSFLQGGEDGARGQIRIGDSSMNIQILKDADRSTFLHETGHFYLEVLKKLAGEPDAPQQIKDDFETVRGWLGHEDGEPISVEQHEQFARGFESYLMEGKAPSEGLRKVFAAFKVWLTNIYRSLKNLHVELTPEVRGVFDRILATDDEIEQAQAKQNFGPLFKDPSIYGLSPEDFAKYQSAIDSAKLAADDELRGKVMKDITQEETKLYKEQRSNIKSRVEEQANSTRVFRARSLLQLDKLPDGSPRPNEIPKLKIDRQSIVEQFGEEILKRLPRMYSNEGGMDVGIVADMLGYESSDQMVQELANSIPKADFVEQQTEAQMKDLHPDLLTSPTLPDEAMSAIHNDKRAAVLRMELDFLARENMPVLQGLIRRVAKRVPTDKQIRAQAEGIVGALNVRELNPGQYRAAEAKHAKEAGEALSRGDIDAAFESKRLELYNRELYKATIDARDDVRKVVRQFKDIASTSEAQAKSRDADLVATTKAVLSAFGIGRSDESPSIILDKLKRYDPEEYAAAHALVEMATAAGSGNYNEISYNRFADMRDAVNGLWDLAKSNKEIEIDGNKVSKEVVIGDLSARIADHTGGESPRLGYDKALTFWDKTKSILLSGKAMLRRTEHWVTAIDGGDKGTFRTHLWNPVSEATTKFRLAKDEMTRHYLTEVIQPSRDIFGQRKIEAPEIGYTFKNKSELLGALLHIGNDSNLSKLLRGRNWGSVDENNNLDRTQWDKFISRMWAEGNVTKADYDYVQGVWDMYDKMKPDAQRTHKKMYGYYFNEVTHNEFSTPFGDYKGGYAPAIADPNLTEDAAIRIEQAQLEQAGNSFMFPTAGRGFTKSRLESYAAPLALDLNYVPMQIDKVLRFTHLEPAVRDVSRIVMDRRFRQSLATLDQSVASEMLVPWLQRTVTQQVSSPSGTGRSWKAADWTFRKIRGNTGLNAMALNVVNTFHQTTGFSMAATKVETRFLRDAVWSYMRDAKGVHDAMTDKSDFMRSKGLQIADIQGDINDLVLHPSKYESAKDFVKANGYILQRLTQGAVETVAWHGAYSSAVERGESDNEAIRSADAVVRQTQHSSAPEDVSRFGTGTPFARLFTMYFDYYNMKANLMTTEAGNMIRETGIKKSLPSLVGLYSAGMMIPAIMSAGFFTAAKGALDQNDDHSYMNDVMRIFFLGQINEGLAMAPVVGPLANDLINRFEGTKHDDRLQLSPAIELLQRAWGSPEELYEALHKNGRKGPAIHDAFSLLGMLTGLPLQPLANPISYAVDVHDNKIKSSGPLDYARGLITGRGPRMK